MKTVTTEEVIVADCTTFDCLCGKSTTTHNLRSALYCVLDKVELVDNGHTIRLMDDNELFGQYSVMQCPKCLGYDISAWEEYTCVLKAFESGVKTVTIPVDFYKKELSTNREMPTV